MRTINWKNATPEQFILWQAVQSLAWYAGAVTIAPLYFQGAIAGSEFETYNASKLYVALDFMADNGGATFSATFSCLNIYNESNAVSLTLKNNTLVYDAVSVKTALKTINAKNIYFSRIANGTALLYSHMRFVGYRLNK